MHLQTSDQEKLKLGFGDNTCNRGTHIAAFYETMAERDEIIMGFLHEGDVQNELQIYFPAERTAENFKEEYAGRYPEYREHLHDRNKLSINSPSLFYYPDGHFLPERILKSQEEYYAESQKNGKRYIRATAEMVRAMQVNKGVEHLMAYESRLNYFFPGKPWLSICLYNITKFPGNIMINVLRTHPSKLSGGAIIRNPYFIDPGEYLRKYYPEFIAKN